MGPGFSRISFIGPKVPHISTQYQMHFRCLYGSPMFYGQGVAVEQAQTRYVNHHAAFGQITYRMGRFVGVMESTRGNPF